MVLVLQFSGGMEPKDLAGNRNNWKIIDFSPDYWASHPTTGLCTRLLGFHPSTWLSPEYQALAQNPMGPTQFTPTYKNRPFLIPTGYRPWIRWHSKPDSVRSCDSVGLGPIRMDGTYPIRIWHREDGCQIPDLNPMTMIWSWDWSHDHDMVMGPVPWPYYCHGTGPKTIIWSLIWSWGRSHDHNMVMGQIPWS